MTAVPRGIGALPSACTQQRGTISLLLNSANFFGKKDAANGVGCRVLVKLVDDLQVLVMLVEPE